MRLAALLVLALGGCGFRVAAGTGDAGGDDAAVDGSDGPLPDTEQPDAANPWSAAILSPGFTGADDPSITGDYLEMFLNTTNDIWVTKRASASVGWGPLNVVSQLSTSSNETTPEISTDGLTMLFSSDRGGGIGAGDIWMSTRANRNAAWGTAANMLELNSQQGDSAPSMSEDRLMIAFTSQRASSLPDIYIATRLLTSVPFGTPQPVTEINTAGHDGSVMLSGDKLVICFDSDRSGNMEIYCASRPTEASTFGVPERMSFNDPNADDSDPWISPDKRLMVWSSNRSGAFEVWYALR